MAPALFQAAALALRAASITCPASPTCPQDDRCSYTANAVSFQVSCATDYYGGDLQLAHTSTVAACMDACSTISNCVAASYVDGNCYLKSSLNVADVNANVIGVAVMSRDTLTTTSPVGGQQTCPSSLTCPENNGCLYTDGSRTLALSCGTDFYGGDFANQYAIDLEACMQTCAANTECVAASFVGGKGAGTCYLKSTKNNPTLNDKVHGIYVVTSLAEPSSPVISIKSTAMTSTSSEMITSTETSIGMSSIVPSSTSSSTAVSTSTTTVAIPSIDISSPAMSKSTDIASPTSQAIASSSSTLSTTSEATTSTASSTQSVSSSATASSDVTSPAGLPSSVIASTSDVSASTSPSPISVIVDGGFEATNSIPWIVRLPAAGILTYNFMDSNDPRSGAQVGSFAYRAGAPALQAWFYQPINLQPNTRYLLSAWTKAGSAYAGCNVYYYIGSADGNVVAKILASIPSSNIKPTWVQSTGFYDSSAAGGAFTFNVRITCNPSSASRIYYIDDISLVSA